MKVQDFQTYDIYYDPEGDFLEILFGESPKEGHSEEIEPGVFIHKVDETGKLYGVGIISFKKRPDILKKIMKKMNIDFPLNITP